MEHPESSSSSTSPPPPGIFNSISGSRARNAISGPLGSGYFLLGYQTSLSKGTWHKQEFWWKPYLTFPNLVLISMFSYNFNSEHMKRCAQEVQKVHIWPNWVKLELSLKHWHQSKCKKPVISKSNNHYNIWHIENRDISYRLSFRQTECFRFYNTLKTLNACNSKLALTSLKIQVCVTIMVLQSKTGCVQSPVWPPWFWTLLYLSKAIYKH